MLNSVLPPQGLLLKLPKLDWKSAKDKKKPNKNLHEWDVSFLQAMKKAGSISVPANISILSRKSSPSQEIVVSVYLLLIPAKISNCCTRVV